MAYKLIITEDANTDIDETMNGFYTERKGAALSISFTLKTVYGEISEVYTYDA